MAKKKKYYVVWEGYEPGIYESWTACQLQIKGYPRAKYKSFSSREEAEAAYASGPQAVAKTSNKASKSPSRPDDPAIIKESISVDAACSGNPGAMEYQGVHTSDGSRLFHQKFQLGTNNVGEFLALVHGIAYLQQLDSAMPIYSDSRIAMNWVKAGKCKTTLKEDMRTRKLFDYIRRAESWLAKNTYKNRLIKWETEQWGEIPADFGRK